MFSNRTVPVGGAVGAVGVCNNPRYCTRSSSGTVSM